MLLSIIQEHLVQLIRSFTMSQVDQHCTYRASCLCGAFAYEVDLPEIREIAECDCSFCVRSANLYISAQDAANFRVVRGSEEQLTSYSFEGNKIHKVRALG